MFTYNYIHRSIYLCKYPNPVTGPGNTYIFFQGIYLRCVCVCKCQRRSYSVASSVSVWWFPPQPATPNNHVHSMTINWRAQLLTDGHNFYLTGATSNWRAQLLPDGHNFYLTYTTSNWRAQLLPDRHNYWWAWQNHGPLPSTEYTWHHKPA